MGFAMLYPSYTALFQSRRLLQAGLLAMALLTVQTAGLIHAAVHLFHTPDHSCVVYLAAEHQGHGLVSAMPVLPQCFAAPDFTALRAVTIYPPRLFAFQARAPPADS